MTPVRFALAILAITVALSGCTLKDDSGIRATPAPPDVAAPPANALRTPSGLAYKVITVGLGSIHPTRQQTARVKYTGWTPDGKMFDSSDRQGGPQEFKLTDVVAGFTEALQLMVVGEKCRFWIPGNLAYDGIPDRPQGMLVFDLELLDIK